MFSSLCTKAAAAAFIKVYLEGQIVHNGGGNEQHEHLMYFGCSRGLGYCNVYLVVVPCLAMRPRAVHIAEGRIYLQLKSAQIGLVTTGSTTRGMSIKKLLQFFKPSGNDNHTCIRMNDR